MLSENEALCATAFPKAFAWTADRFAPLLIDRSDPLGAARQLLRRQCEKGLLCCGEFDVANCSIGNAPLWTSESGLAPDYDAMAYALERRFSQGSKRTRVYWPSSEFAKRHGSWTGCDSYPCPHKVSHDLLVTDVWMHFWKRHDQFSTSSWFSERQLQWQARQAQRPSPIPDALFVNGRRIEAIEIGGNYPASWLRHHVEQFTVIGWDIAIF